MWAAAVLPSITTNFTDIRQLLQDVERYAQGAINLVLNMEQEGFAHAHFITHGPSVAARWNGSGRRNGRLVFTLRAPTASAYTVPVRFVLAAP